MRWIFLLRRVFVEFVCYVHLSVCVCTCAYGGQRTTKVLDTEWHPLFLFSLEMGFSQTCGSSSKLDWLASKPQDCPVPTSSALWLWTSVTTPRLLHVFMPSWSLMIWSPLVLETEMLAQMAAFLCAVHGGLLCPCSSMEMRAYSHTVGLDAFVYIASP